MKKKAIWLWTSALLFVLIVATSAAVALTFSEAPNAEAKRYEAENASAPLAGIVSPAAQIAAVDGAEPQLLAEAQGRQRVLRWDEGQTVEWKVVVSEDASYSLSVGYYPLDGTGQDIEFRLFADGSPVAEKDTIFRLNRIWRDAQADLARINGNELRSRQEEARVWLESRIGSADALVGSSLQLKLAKGEHRIRLENLRESALLDYLLLTKQEAGRTYAEYRATLDPQATAGAADSEAIVIEAERAYLKSESGLYPTVDRSSPITTPYHPTKIRINTIGASNWNVSGQWISWKFEVPEDGAYKIGMRYRQNKLKGAFSARKMYIDGQVPFQELDEVRFDNASGWKVKELGEETGEPYAVYLTKGTHELKMEVTLGAMGPFLQEVQETVYQLNERYRKIIMITGVKPDSYRDYELDKSMPDLVASLKTLRDRLKDESDRLVAMTGRQNEGSRALSRLSGQLDGFAADPDSIPKQLGNYINNVTALADWIIDARYQPLELDKLYVAGASVKLPADDASLVAKAAHEIRAFVGSFFEDYDSLGTESTEAGGRSVEVWIGSGRDQAYVVKRLIDEQFTPSTGINVEVNLVRNALVVAVMAGKGPDINLFTRRGEAMDLAIRGALSPLDTRESFDGLKGQYMPSAFEPYEYDGHTYAVPDEQEFFMMYYREDILDDLGLKPPQTWDDLMDIAPVLQNSNLQIGLPYENLDASQLKDRGIGTLNLFPTLLMQRGISLYNDARDATRLDEPTAADAFAAWTNFYKLYDYPLYKSDYYRFRTGQMPIVIATYRLYSLLSVAAPEIAGSWRMAQIPGVPQPDGTINRASAATGTSAIMLNSAKDKDAAWQFMQWWNSPEVQSQYAQELENETGEIGRKTPANVEAFKRSRWSVDEQRMLLEQWKEVQEVPELPGSYYTTRSLDNAFRGVVFQWRSPRESLNKWNKQINEEIKRKRYEFGVEP
ncbi:extracellular solute-binding protein [Cohnella sp.]|uniref:extracellular solute-binding protein n=1 Tax=Cohnella sp. TaxID=1883426 RepID=UPI00356449F4